MILIYTVTQSDDELEISLKYTTDRACWFLSAVGFSFVSYKVGYGFLKFSKTRQNYDFYNPPKLKLIPH